MSDKLIHVTLKMNLPAGLAERAASGDYAAFEALSESAAVTMEELIAQWALDGSPYGPAETPKAPSTPVFSEATPGEQAVTVWAHADALDAPDDICMACQ